MTALDLPVDGEAAWGNKLRAAMNTTVNVADLALSTANQAVSGTATGLVQLDSFTGANDDAKLTAALTYAAAQTNIPTIQFPARSVTLSQSRAMFSGMKFIGPPGAVGAKNLELSSGKLVNHRVLLNVGTGASSWLIGNSGNIYDVYVGDMAFQGGSSNAQFLHCPLGNTLYVSQFHSLDHYGFKHAFGNPSAKCAITAVNFTGLWQNQSGYDTQFTLGGSDSSLWMYGQINLQTRASGGAAEGYYQMILDTLGKTSLGYAFITSSGNSRGLWIKSDQAQRVVSMFNGSYEGYNTGAMNHGANIRIDGGCVRMYGTWTAQAMDPSFGGRLSGENGVILVNGGNVLIDGLVYDRGTANINVPLIYHTGGRCEIRSVAAGTATTGFEQPQVHTTGAGTFIADSSVTVV